MKDKFGLANEQYRDSVFRDFFNEPARLLSLCNALLDSDFENADEIEINTLQGNFFSAIKNDISCKIGDQFLILIEHQSSVNNNMPFRCLSYVVELLNNLVIDKSRFYSRQVVKFPAPKFFVFYDGDDSEPLQREMRLSDAFSGDGTTLELVVKSLNINYGLNQPLIEKCSYLSEYSTLIGKIKQGCIAGLSRRQAIIEAVNWCIENGIMAGYLSSKRNEVFTMLDWQWNLDDAKAAWKEEGREEGIEQGERQRAEKIAVRMIKRGKSFAEIHEDTDLPLCRIYELAELIEV